MGAKNPEAHHQSDGDSPSTEEKSATVSKPAGNRTFLQDDLGGDDSDDDEDDDAARVKDHTPEADGKEKKKRKNNKKKKKNKKTRSGAVTVQSAPPRVPLHALFPSEIYPEGEIASYANRDDNLSRTTAEEIRHLSLVKQMDDDFLKEYRQAAEVHRQVRQWTQQTVKPGHTMSQIAQEIEDGVRALTGHQGLDTGDALKASMGFPTGLCLNNVAAHWTPNPGGKEIVLGYDDVMSVDFGVHVNGRIVDSAFTMAFNPVYDNLLTSVKEATNTGIREAGIDARISHIGAAIQEVMESYEVEIKGKVIPVKAIRNLCGHDIKRYRIHGDKQIPFIKNSSSQRMEEGEIFAIETFGSTGKGYVNDDSDVYGYGLNNSAATPPPGSSASTKSLLNLIKSNFGTVVFCRRYLERLLQHTSNGNSGTANGSKKGSSSKAYLFPLHNLVNAGIVSDYFPLSDVKGSYVAQFEHTILLRKECKEVVSRGEDY